MKKNVSLALFLAFLILFTMILSGCKKTPDVTHFQASNLCENHILLRGPVVYFRREEPEKGQAWRKCG